MWIEKNNKDYSRDKWNRVEKSREDKQKQKLVLHDFKNL